MDYEQYRIPAYFVVILIGGSFNAKFQTPSIVMALALVAFANNPAACTFVFGFYVGALVLSGFRG